MQIFNDIFDSIFKPKAYNRFLKYKGGFYLALLSNAQKLRRRKWKN